MKILAFITDPSVICQILNHLENRNNKNPPIPPDSQPQA